MIYALSLIVIYVIIDSFLKKIVNLKSKEIGFAMSLILVLCSFLLGYQDIIIPGFFERNNSFSLLKYVFALSITISIILDKEKATIFRKVVSVALLSSNSLEFQATFLFGALLVEKIYGKREFNLKSSIAILLLIVICLGSTFGSIGNAIISLVFLSLLLKEEYVAEGRPKLFNSIFFSIVLLVFLDQTNSAITQFFSTLISIIFLFNRGSRLVKFEKNNFLCFLSLTYIFLSILAVTGLKELFYFIGTFFFIAFFVKNSKPNTSINWILFFILFFFSPPFGLGYMVRIEVFEAALKQPWFLSSLVGLFTVFTQLFTILVVLNLKESFLEELKKFKFSYDYRASLFLVLSILLSILFLPDNWVEGYGSLFKTKLSAHENMAMKNIGIGYYLFWTELIVWALAVLLYYKTSPKFFNRMYFLNISLSFKKTKITKIEPGFARIENINERAYLKGLTSALEIGKNELPPQYFTMIMLIILGLLLAGVA